MKKIKIVLMVIGSIFIVSCESNTYREISVTTTNPTYVANIQPIIAANCVGCHSAGATTPTLETYAQVKTATQTGNVICRMDQTCGSVMPPNGTMTQGTIEMIKLWKQQGFVN